MLSVKLSSSQAFWIRSSCVCIDTSFPARVFEPEFDSDTQSRVGCLLEFFYDQVFAYIQVPSQSRPFADAELGLRVLPD